MSEGPARFVAQHVHDLIERQRLDALPDRALLRRFLDGDEAAFAALVRRHGRGRQVLRSRFTRKGLTLPAALLPLLVEQVAPATAPSVLAAPSTAAARLADGLLRSMALARAKLAAWATAAVLVAGTAVG